MKKEFSPKPVLTPQMIQMIGTYNEDGTPNLMNAAWGGQLTPHEFVLSLTKTHKTVKNIEREKCFTLGFPSCKDIVDCDYVGMVSGNKTPNKLENTRLHSVPSTLVHAPVFEEFPLTMECVVKRVIDDPELGFYVIGEVKRMLVDEEALNEKGVYDVEKMDLCFFSPLDNSYRAYGKEIARAFACGTERKK